jgi:hypothetical protein
MSDEATAKFKDRADGIEAWLLENAPYCSSDQRHLDENTPERAYWHYGYRAALLDVINQLEPYRG